MVYQNMWRSRKYIIICLLFKFLFSIKFKAQYVSNSIYYQEPLLNIKFMNLTLAAIFPLIESGGQFATMSLFKNSLYNVTTKQQLPSNNIYNLAGFFGALGSEINKIKAEISSGTGIPFVDPGTIDLVGSAFKTSLKPRSENKTYYQIRDTEVYDNVNVVINIMKAYNWTICGNIYQGDVVGLTAQQEIQNYASKFSSPIFTCNEILTDDDLTDDQFITNFCTCMNNIRTLTVINLWTDPLLAYSLIFKLKKKCSSASKYVFIMTGESKPLPQNFFTETEIFKTTLIIRSFGLQNFSAYVDECLATSSPQASTAVSSLVNDILLNSFNCYTSKDENSTLPLCPDSIYGRTQPCICSGNEFDPEFNAYSAQNFFFADAISTYAYVISLVQNNCSYVNEITKSKKLSILDKIDFCKIENLTPTILSGLLILTNFTGYTGKINFSSNSNIRSYKTYYLYNVQTTISELKLVGNFSINGYYLNKSDIILPSGNNTISKLVPQNPNLTYAVISVFFGILIFLVISSFIALVYLIVNINHPLIRRNTPNMSIVVLVGIILYLAGSIIICTGLTDASCIIYFFFENLGFSLLIGGIIAKSYRIYRIFNNSTATAVVISDLQLFSIVFVIALYFMILSVIMVSLGLEVIVSQSSTNRFYLFYRCAIPNEFWSVFFTILIELSIIIFLLAALILALSTHHVAFAYSEADTVLALLILYLCLDISFLPLYYTLQDGTDSAVLKATIRLIVLSITVVSTLALLFLSRFYKVHQNKKKIKKRNNSDLNRNRNSD